MLGVSVGAGEIILVLAVLILLFGARKLPELARSIGSSARELRKGLKEDDDEADEEADEEEETEAAAPEPAAESDD